MKPDDLLLNLKRTDDGKPAARPNLTSNECAIVEPCDATRYIVMRLGERAAMCCVGDLPGDGVVYLAGPDLEREVKKYPSKLYRRNAASAAMCLRLAKLAIGIEV